MKNVFKLQVYRLRRGVDREESACNRLRRNVYGGWQCTIGYWLIEVRFGR